MNKQNASSSNRIVYKLTDNKIIVESRQALDFREIKTICTTWPNTEASLIISSFGNICSRNNQKWQPLIRQAIKTIEDIQPTNINLGKTTVKPALLEIKICTAAKCSFENADVILIGNQDLASFYSKFWREAT